MSTITLGRWGYIAGQGSSNFTTARQTGQTAFDRPGGNQTIAFRYFFSSGRGATHSMYRTYLYFDTSGISGLIPVGTTAVLNITGVTNNGGDFTVIKSSAFGGDGNTALATSDFYNSLSYGTAYAGEETSWSSSGNNAISLNSNALNDIYTNDDFTLAIINYTYDFSNSASSTSVTLNNGIAFGTAITLVVTEPSDIAFVNTVAVDDIGFMNTVAFGEIGSINTVS